MWIGFIQSSSIPNLSKSQNKRIKELKNKKVLMDMYKYIITYNNNNNYISG